MKIGLQYKDIYMIIRKIIHKTILNELDGEEYKSLCEFTKYRTFEIKNNDLVVTFQTKKIFNYFLETVKPCYELI